MPVEYASRVDDTVFCRQYGPKLPMKNFIFTLLGPCNMYDFASIWDDSSHNFSAQIT